MRLARLRTSWQLSWLIVGLAAIASGGGLLFPNIYQETDAFFRTAWYGNDWVTLVAVVPTLVLALWWSWRGSQRAQLVWLGGLWYMLYNYAFYLFGAVFNAFFLLYVALFTLSLYALFLGLYHLGLESIRESFRDRTPVRWISGFLIFISLPLLIVEGGQCVNFILTGKVPEVPSLIFALDLSFVIPASILGGILLWQRRAWGFVLAALMLVKGATYGLVLTTNTLLINARKLVETPDPLLPFYMIVAVGSLVFGWLLLRNLREDETTKTSAKSGTLPSSPDTQ